jgi:hypothetical protein
LFETIESLSLERYTFHIKPEKNFLPYVEEKLRFPFYNTAFFRNELKTERQKSIGEDCSLSPLFAI